jgi:hypothetical protein
MILRASWITALVFDRFKLKDRRHSAPRRKVCYQHWRQRAGIRYRCSCQGLMTSLQESNHHDRRVSHARAVIFMTIHRNPPQELEIEASIRHIICR